MYGSFNETPIVFDCLALSEAIDAGRKQLIAFDEVIAVEPMADCVLMADPWHPLRHRFPGSLDTIRGHALQQDIHAFDKVHTE